ncbi:MAG TPA: hypothetical protein VMW75_18900, partial [Thermoanaerobaculia bacterium]|nr:hypothetical protein [Thermoanaerobaculia bacterium]
MSDPQTAAPSARQPLRLWPGVVAAVLLCVLRFVIPLFLPGATAIGMLGALAGALAILVWWLFFSRAPWTERLGGLALAIVALAVTSRLIHVSIATGMMGMMFLVYAIPVLCVA